jgi:hypothetical protein
MIWPRFHEGRPAVVEARSPIQADGAKSARELAAFQEARFGQHVQKLAERLQDILGWDEREIDLHQELERIRSVRREPRDDTPSSSGGPTGVS